MARGKGYQGIVGRKKGSTWGTTVVPASGDGLEVVSLDMGDAGTEGIEDNQITGIVTQRLSAAGAKSVMPKFTTGLRYEGNEFDIALMLGTAGVPTTTDTSAYQHALKLKDDPDGIFASLAYEYIKDTKVAQVASYKPSKITLKGEAKGKFMLEVDSIGYEWIDDSTTNTTTTIDSVTLPSNREFALFSQAAFRINANSGGGLSASEDVYITAFELTVERPYDARVSTRFGDKTDEPIPSGFAKVSGSVTVPALDSGTGGATGFYAWQKALTALKAKLIITSPNLAGAATQYYQHVLWLPSLQLGKGRPGIPGPQGETVTFPFTANHVTSVPTGFTSGYTGAVVWEVFSQKSGDPLA